MKYHIALILGDGIGPELIESAVKVLDKIGGVFGHGFRFSSLDAGGCAIDRHGIPLPAETLETCLEADSVLLGAVGGPKWDHLEGELRPEKALLGLRKELGLFANIRPALLHQALKDACPLRPDIAAGGIDICIVRELTGGIYFGERGSRTGPGGKEVYDTEYYSQHEVERIARTAFRIAEKRGRRVTSVDKANVLHSSRLWRDVVTETAREYPSIELEHMLVDNAAMQLIRNPGQFDVILTTNMFGDILSDEASMITGSIGMLPSASLGESSRGMYEPIHGSAPDIAGQDKANPIATILSAEMMMRFSLGLTEAADVIGAAVTEVLAKGFRTPDIHSPGMKRAGTREMTELIVDAVESVASEKEKIK